MAESLISPAELFKAQLPRAKDIPTLKRNEKDKFILFQTREFASTTIAALRSTKGLKLGYRQYLIDLVNYVNGTLKSAVLEASFKAHRPDINLEETIKYFGEVVGALHVAKKYSASQICYPVRSNYELFDYFLSNNKGGWKGYSAKALSGGSNTLAPKLIADRIEKAKIPAKDTGAQVLLLLANAPTFQGTVEAVGLLVKARIYPATMASDKTLQAEFGKIAWERDAVLIEKAKNTPIRKLGVSRPLAYESFLTRHVVPRMRNKVPSVEKFTATNLVYGLLAMYVADTSKEGRFNVTPLISKLFPDLNIVKMGIGSNGVPVFHLTNRGESTDAVTLRSKARWEKIKDKLGVQL